MKITRGWQNNIQAIPNAQYYRQLSVSAFIDAGGNNLCFEEGFNANEVFELKLKKKIWSIPERWKYTDAARTVRPIMADESFELLRLLDRENSDIQNRRTVTAANLANFLPINFILNNNIVIDEKIIEGWFLQNLGRNAQVDLAIGPLTTFGNNLPVGYLRFMDIFGYHQLQTGVKKYKVMEVKLGQAIFPDDINQLIGYLDWIIENIAIGDSKIVEGILIARGFGQNMIDFVTNFNTLARKIRLVQFDYDPPNFQTLNITRVV